MVSLDRTRVGALDCTDLCDQGIGQSGRAVTHDSIATDEAIIPDQTRPPPVIVPDDNMKNEGYRWAVGRDWGSGGGLVGTQGTEEGTYQATAHAGTALGPPTSFWLVHSRLEKALRSARPPVCCRESSTGTWKSVDLPVEGYLLCT